jgi:hypothetical protein
MRCPNCPIPPDLGCIGERAKRICDLVNPSHPDYQPGYRDTIPRHPPPIENPDLLIARVESMAARALSGERGGGCGACP